MVADAILYQSSSYSEARSISNAVSNTSYDLSKINYIDVLFVIFADPYKFDSFTNTTVFSIANPSSLGNYYKYDSSFVRFFGLNARQNANSLFINKSDLPLLTARLFNTAESLLIAILLQVEKYESNSITSNIVVTFWKTGIQERNNQRYKRIIYLVILNAILKYNRFESIKANDLIAPSDYN